MRFIAKLVNVNCAETESIFRYLILAFCGHILGENWPSKSYHSFGQTSDVPQVLQKGLKVRDISFPLTFKSRE